MNLNSRRRVIFIVATSRPLVLAATDAPSVRSPKRPERVEGTGKGSTGLVGVFSTPTGSQRRIYLA